MILLIDQIVIFYYNHDDDEWKRMIEIGWHWFDGALMIE